MVVTTPATWLVLDATSHTICAPMFSNCPRTLGDGDAALVTPEGANDTRKVGNALAGRLSRGPRTMMSPSTACRVAEPAAFTGRDLDASQLVDGDTALAPSKTMVGPTQASVARGETRRPAGLASWTGWTDWTTSNAVHRNGATEDYL